MFLWLVILRLICCCSPKGWWCCIKGSELHLKIAVKWWSCSVTYASKGQSYFLPIGYIVNSAVHCERVFCLWWQTVHGVLKTLHFFTRQKRFLAASLVVFTTQHVSLRLVWALNNIPQVNQKYVKHLHCHQKRVFITYLHSSLSAVKTGSRRWQLLFWDHRHLVTIQTH